MKRVLMFLLVAMVLFLGYAATRPDTFHVERSITIAAPADAIYPKVAEFHQWPAWSPWEHLDPNMKTEFLGTDGAVGASYGWTGNDKVGQGRMTLTEIQPPQKVGIKLEFLKPYQATSAGTFAFTPEGAGTKVTWSMDGTNNYMAKVMCIFMNMDKTIGADFEKGLATLKSQSESAAAAPAGGAAPADSAHVH